MITIVVLTKVAAVLQPGPGVEVPPRHRQAPNEGTTLSVQVQRVKGKAGKIPYALQPNPRPLIPTLAHIRSNIGTLLHFGGLQSTNFPILGFMILRF